MSKHIKPAKFLGRVYGSGDVLKFRGEKKTIPIRKMTRAITHGERQDAKREIQNAIHEG